MIKILAALSAGLALVTAQSNVAPVYTQIPQTCLDATTAPTVTFLDFNDNPVSSPSAYYNQPLQYVVNGLQGCTYALLIGDNQPLYLTIPYTTGPTLGGSAGTSSPFMFNAPSDATSTGFPFVAALYTYEDVLSSPNTQQTVPLYQCDVPSYIFANPALADGGAAGAILQGVSGEAVAANIQGQDGCQYTVTLQQFDISTSSPVGTPITQSVTYLSGQPVSFNAPVLASDTTPQFYELEIAPAVVPASSTMVPTLAAFIVNPSGCIAPGLVLPGDPTSPVNVLAGAKYPVTITGTPNCQYIFFGPGNAAFTPNGLNTLQVPNGYPSGAAPLYIGFDTVSIVSSAASINVLQTGDCSDYPFSIQTSNFPNMPSASASFSVYMTEGVFGCTYGASASSTSPTYSQVFSLILQPGTTSFTFNLPSDFVGSGDGTVYNDADSTPFQFSTSQSCSTTTPTVVDAPTYPFSPRSSLDFVINGSPGCVYSVWFFPNADTVLQGVEPTSISVNLPSNQEISTNAPQYAGTYTVILAIGTVQPSPSDVIEGQSFVLIVDPICYVVTPAIQTPPDFTAGYGQTWSAIVQGEPGCSYQIDTTPPISFTMPLFYDSAILPALPPFYELESQQVSVVCPASGLTSSTSISVSPLCTIPPTFAQAFSSAVEDEQFSIQSVGQLGCPYYFQYMNNGPSSAFTTASTSKLVGGANANQVSFYANPTAPFQVGTFQYGYSLTNNGPITPLFSTGVLTTTYADCSYTIRVAGGNQFNTQTPTFSVSVANPDACGASITGLFLLFGGGPQRRGMQQRYYADPQSPGAFTYTPTSPLSTNYNSVTAYSGTSNSQPYTFSFVAPSGGGTRKRQLKCDFGQDRCPVRSKSGKVAFGCVDDLYTNLERCGSCRGPDCSQIPFADNVACVDGQCVVESCEYGFVSTGRGCVPRFH